MMLKDYIHTIKPLSRGLPKTGQEVSYATGDDGKHEAGWWSGLLNANNRTRFLVKTLAGNDVVIDLATGLMWARDGNAVGCYNGDIITWSDAVITANGMSFAGFDDWRLPNIIELLSIVKYNTWNPAIWPVFTNTKYTLAYWSSTSRAYATTNALCLGYSEGNPERIVKTDYKFMRAVRGGV